jgi:LPXTG-motif cell wall-anchored protein
MVGIIIGIIMVGTGGFFWVKKNKKIGAPCLIVGALVLGISMVVAGIV